MSLDHPQDPRRHRRRQRRPRRARVRYPAQRARHAPGGDGPAGRPPCRHAEHQDPRRGLRWRQEAVQAEGHRQRPPGLDPCPALQRWRRRPRPQAAQVRPEDPQEDDQPRPALGPLGPRRRGQGHRRRRRGASTAEDQGRRCRHLGRRRRPWWQVDARPQEPPVVSSSGRPQRLRRAQRRLHPGTCPPHRAAPANLPPRGPPAAPPAADIADAPRRRSVADPAMPLRLRRAVPAGDRRQRRRRSSPEDYAIKGNGDSGLYHRPGTAFYNRTIAEFWFKTAEDAEAAGFLLPPSQRDDKGDQS